MTSRRVVAVVLAADDSKRMAWAISGALAMARRLAGGRKVLLADLQCGAPSALAEALGAKDEPGIVDVLFRGTSLGSVARRPPSEPFTFLPRGEDPPSLAEIYRHPGWARIAGRLQGTKAVFLACVSADDWLEMGPIPGFEACIVFNGTDGEVRLPQRAQKITEAKASSEGRSGRAADGSLPDSAAPGATVQVEPPAGRGTRTPRRAEIDEADRPLDEATTPEASSRDSSKPPTTGPGAGAEFSESAADRSPPSSRRSPSPAALRMHFEYIESLQLRRRGRKRMLYGSLAAAAIAIGLGAMVWLTVGAGCTDRANAEGSGDAGWGAVTKCVVAELGSLTWLGDAGSEHAPISLARTDRSGDGADEDAASGVSSSGCGAADPGCAGLVAGRSLPYSVVVGEFSTLDEARRRLQESGRIPVPFYVAPAPREDGVRFRLFAGLLANRLDAEEMLSRLVYSGMKYSLKENDIKRVRYAFSFGVYRSEAEARSLLDRLLEHGVPGYLVQAATAGEGGVQAFHAYAGAFESPDESTSLLDSIRRAGLTAELVERTGLLPD